MQQTDSPLVGPHRRPAQGKASWQSVSEPDLADPFYFDHPLDHVPGIMLIVALLGLVRQAAGPGEPAPPEYRGGDAPADRGRLRTAFSFLRFCELDARTELRAWPEQEQPGQGQPGQGQPGHWAFAAEQGPVRACAGTAAFAPAAPRGGCHPVPVPGYRSPPSPRPIAGHLVHRRREENILLGEASREDAGPVRWAVLSPPSGRHPLAILGGAARTPEELIEAARQATLMLWGTSYGWPVETRLTLNSVSAELPVAVDRDRPLELRCWPGEIRGNKARSCFELVAGSDRPERIGSIEVCMQAWSERAWQRVRSAQRREAAAAADARC